MGPLPALLRGRARHAGGRWAVVIAGLALAVLLPVVTGAVTRAAASGALRQALGALPPGERSVIVSYNGIVDDAERHRYDVLVAQQLPRIATAPVRRQLLFRALTDTRGGTFVLGAGDDLATRVRLVDGRLPASCTPTRCEVVVVGSGAGGTAGGAAAGGAAGALATDPRPDLGLVVVGHVVRTDPLLLTGTFDPGPDAPLILADGVDAASRLASLESFGRSYGWVAPLDADRVRALGADAWVREGAAVALAFDRTTAGLEITTPVDEVRDQDARATVSAQRFTLLGGTVAVLLLGTAVVGGAALRRDHEAFVGALRRRGARRGQVVGLVTGEVLAAVVAGVTAGLVVGAGIAAVIAARARLPVAGTAADAVRDGAGQVAVLAAAAAVLVGLTLVLGSRATPPASGAGAAWRWVDAAAITCVVVAALLMARGGITATTSASGGAGDPLLALLPALLLVAAGLAVARVWPLLTRAGGRTLRRGSVAARIGLSAAAGRPLRPAATAALLTAAVAAAVFAGSYRATLDRGAGDQAAYTVPLDARLQVGRTSQQPLDAVPADVLAAAVSGRSDGVVPVVRGVASAAVTALQGAPVQVVGLPPAALASLARWSAVTGTPDASVAAQRITVPAVLPGLPLPQGRTLRIATPSTPAVVAVSAFVRDADGREAGIPLQVNGSGASASLDGDLPRGLVPPLHLVALELRLPVDQQDRRQHNLGEGDSDRSAPTGRLALGGLAVDGVAVDAPWRGWAAEGLSVDGSGDAATLDYELLSGRLVVQARPDGPGTTTPLPVIADEQTARDARSGALTLTLNGAAVQVRVVQAARGFPTTQGRFVVADGQAVARLLDLGEPGTGGPDEVWLAAPPGGLATLAEALTGAPFDRLTVTRRQAVETALRTDPIAGAASGLLAAGAGLVLLVGALALVLLVVADRREDAPAAYAWEADGVAPGTLRAALWWRATAVAVPAVPAGVLVGVGLSQLTSGLVAVTATAVVPRPPLVPGTGVAATALAVFAGLVVALAVAAAVAAGSLREPLPVRSTGVGR